MADVVALSPITPHPSSLAAAADAFLDHADVAATTRRVYRMSLAALVDGLGPARSMADLTGELVDDWFRTRYATVAPATWNPELATLRSAVAWWRAHGWLATDPTISLARQREHPDRTRALRKADLEALWRRDDLRLRDKTLWRLLYETAARANEALNLNLEDLDLANKRARVTSKGGDTNWLHFQTGSTRLLPRLIAGRTRGPLFLADRAPVPARAPAAVDRCPETGRARLSYRRAEALFHEASGGWTLHQLRHSALTHLAEQNVSLPLLMAKSRHANLRSLQRYARPGAEAVAALTAATDPARRRG